MDFTEEQIKTIGFELKMAYCHDQYHTKRYVSGIMEVEFTYEGKELVCCDLSLNETNCLAINFEKLKALSDILAQVKE